MCDRRVLRVQRRHAVVATGEPYLKTHERHPYLQNLSAGIAGTRRRSARVTAARAAERGLRRDGTPPGAFDTQTASPAASAALQRALTEWRACLGDEHVRTDAPALSQAQTATFASAQRVPAWIRPDSTPQVQACVAIAQRHGVPLYPVSGGRNWGLGSRVPPRSGCVLLDLGRMNRILHFDRRLAHISVEPGVSFAQVHAFLADRAPELYCSSIGGSPRASLIGNALERGDGDGPLGDRAAHASDLEVVLANGDVIRTGFSRFAGARAACRHRWGVGPALDQLFFQSNLGVVTRMTFALARQPDHLWAWKVHVDGVPALRALVDVLQEQVLAGVLSPGAVSLWNEAKLRAREGVHEVGAQSGRWHACGMVGGPSRAVTLALRELVCTALHGCAEALVEGEVKGPFMGQPSEDNLRTLYVCKPGGAPVDMDPDRDRCGVMWVCPALPFEGAQVADALDVVEAICMRHGSVPQIGMGATSPRNLASYVTLVYDREVPGEDARVLACHDALLDALIVRGFLPYRLGIQSMRCLPADEGPYERALADIKRALDPQGILAPGRYLP